MASTKTQRAAKPAAHKTPATTGISMTRPLALSPAERGISRNAARALTSVQLAIKTACATITTPEALNAFWTEGLGSYVTRNIGALPTIADVATGKTARVPQGIRNARPKAAGAGA